MPKSRARATWERTTRAAASAAGMVMRGVALSGMSIGGAILVSYGLGEIYRPLLWIAAGTFVLLVDRKQANERKDGR